MEKIRFRKNSFLKEIIHQGLKHLGYDIVYQDIVHHRIIIYKNRQNHTAMIYDAGTREASFTLVDYYKSVDIQEIAQPFLEMNDKEMRLVGATLLQLKSIL